METEVIAEAVSELKNSGKIRAFGLSNFTPSQTDLIKKYSSVVCNQIQFSATHLQPMLNGELDYMMQHNIQPMAWNPLGSVYKEVIPQTIRLRDLLQKLTEKYGVSDDLLLLAWVLKHPAKIQPVVGTTQIDRIKNLKKLKETTSILYKNFSYSKASIYILMKSIIFFISFLILSFIDTPLNFGISIAIVIL